jgi:cation diffusion facilitator CzcD-associated flavoprotein CzcO
MSSPNDQRHTFGPSLTVAVIGAGISGVCAAAYLLRQGLRVTVFERSGIAGGVWHYDERVLEDSPYPNNPPSRVDYRVSYDGEFTYTTPSPKPEIYDDGGDSKASGSGGNIANLEVQFSPPGPCYAGLKNNVPTFLMASALAPWPEETGRFVSQRKVEEYIQRLAKDHGSDAVTLFHTRVDEVRKTTDGSKWAVRAVTLEKREEDARLIETHFQFDLLVVASGHSNISKIPDIEGLRDWKASYPDRMMHSKQYRSPEKYRGQNILVIGAGVSALDICRELSGVANKTWQSVRGGKFDLPPFLLPESTIRIPEVTNFDPHSTIPKDSQPADKGAVPGTIELKGGQVLDDVDHVILATGYITSYPFPAHLHSDNTCITEAGEELLVTSDGEMTHNLHRDIFYIPDPTLAFVGVPYYVATFSLFDFQAQAVARVFAGKARLPTKTEMRREYEKRVEQTGLGRGFHSLHGRGLEIAYVQGLVDWMNSSLAGTGEPLMLGHSEGWKQGYDEFKAKTMASFKPSKEGGQPGVA